LQKSHLSELGGTIAGILRATVRMVKGLYYGYLKLVVFTNNQYCHLAVSRSPLSQQFLITIFFSKWSSSTRCLKLVSAAFSKPDQEVFKCILKNAIFVLN